MKKITEIVLAALFIALLTVCAFFAYDAYTQCTESGGMFVRNLFGASCVKTSIIQ